jgi:sugar lactone lactonase YvrE
MNANKKILALVVFVPLGFGQSWIDDYVQEAGAMNKACVAKEYPACRGHLLKLEELLDGRVDIVYRLAKAEAMLGNKDAALARLQVFSKSGLTFADPAVAPEFASLKNSPEFETILARVKAARGPVSASKPFLTLPERDLIAEDIVYDPGDQKFYISSVRHSKILSLDMHGGSAEFVHGAWPIMALGVDSKRRILWASAVAIPEGIGFRKEDEGRSALLKYSLDTGALLKRYDPTKDAKHALGDMTVSADGDVFVSDGEGAVYWVEHGKDALDILVPKGVFHSPQTPALSPDGRRLFVPDYSRGIGIVDLASRQVKLLEHPKELSLGGIDGMYLSGRTLIAIQNGTAPERLIRMKLDESLTRVLEWGTIEANWPGLGDPTHGVVVGQQFYFIANSGWDLMADDGSLKPGAAFEPATIRQMQLDAKPTSPITSLRR